MFSTLESTWDHSARRQWSTFASFGFQALMLSLLLAVPYFWIQGPARVTWLEPPIILGHTIEQPSQLTPPPEQTQRTYRAGSVSNVWNGQLLEPREVPKGIGMFNDAVDGPPAPDIPDVVFERGGPNTTPYAFGGNMPAVMPKPPSPSRPLIVSRWSEGNVIFRVQPIYPTLARQAGVEGPVVLRAIVSKNGAIENLTVVSGHPLLVRSALDAVRQWRYRPYLLNGEPIAIDTEITVKFILSR